MKIGFAGDRYYYENNQKVMLAPNENISRSTAHVDYYKNEKGIILGVTNQLILKLKDDSNLQTYLNEYNLTIKANLGKNLYLLKAENNNLAIDAANALSNKNDVKYSHPDFIEEIISR